MTEVNITINDIQSNNPGLTLKSVVIQGQLDESNVDEKIKDVYKVIESNPKNLGLIFDFEGLEYMNSKSIGYLTDLYGKISENGGGVAVAKARPNILDILQVVGLTQLIPALDSTDLAKNKLETDFTQKNGTTVAPATPAPAATTAPASTTEAVPQTPAAASQPTDSSTFSIG